MLALKGRFMVTGKSVLVSKEVDSPVLSQIISLVETAQMSKAPIQKFADYVSRLYKPVILASSVGAYPEEWLPEKGTHFVFSHVLHIRCGNRLSLCTRFGNQWCTDQWR
uniref:Uncharacterized protein n=1 Tax=Brassica oleracea TaxID=3712 RepID=A0A3P6DD49_BRAOL|nr:unnamed protein product [Brassica oleracea]